MTATFKSLALITIFSAGSFAQVSPVVGLGWGGPKGLIHLGATHEEFTVVGALDEFILGSQRYRVVAPAIAGGWRTPIQGIELWSTISVQHISVDGNGVSLIRDTHVGSAPLMKNGWNPGLASFSIARRFGQSFGVTPSIGYGVFFEDLTVGMIRVGFDVDWRGTSR